MPKAVRRLDPLVEGCAALGSRQGVGAERLGPALETWLTPLWSALPPLFAIEDGASTRGGRDAVLLAAACRLADLGARLHPDHRAALAFEQVLRAPIAGQTHAERAFLATAVHARHSSQTPARNIEAVERVLGADRLRRARALGAALRLGCDLSGRTPALLAGCTLKLDVGAVLLTVRPGSADLLLGEQTKKRLTTLSTILGLNCRIRRA